MSQFIEFNCQLALYDEMGDSLIPLKECLTLYRTSKAQWTPGIEDCSILLEISGKEWVASTWNLGNLDLVILQIESALSRLSQGEPAIIRSAILESGVYLLLERPSSNSSDLIYISLFFIYDDKLRATFPIEGICGSSTELYNYVCEHRTEILTTQSDFRELPYPSLKLMESLKQEVILGRQLLEISRPSN